MTCQHENFVAVVAVNRITATEGGPVTHFDAAIKVRCADCGLEFEFRGVPDGYSPYGPTVSIDGKELSVPVMPPGMQIPEGLPGFRVHVHTSEHGRN